jgi:exopolysaccharide production protein ExoQ
MDANASAVAASTSYSASLREGVFPTLFVVYYFTLTNIQVISIIVPICILAGFIPFVILYSRELLYFLTKNWIVAVLPAVVLLSSLWSATPTQSFSYGVQLCITITIGVLIGVATTQRQFVLGVFIAMALVTVVSIASGRTGPSAVGPVLIGITGSKDQMGFVGMTLGASGLAVAFDRTQSWLFRSAAVFLIPVGAYVATHVESATPKIGLIGFFLAFCGIIAMRYFRFNGRIALIMLALAVTVPAAVGIMASVGNEAGDKILQGLGKDRTLTGRTLLWEEADQWIRQSPEIGHGYRSFWVGNSPDSLGLLHRFELTDGRTFQFHHTYREIMVDMGALGLIAFLLVATLFIYKTVKNALIDPGPGSAFMASMLLLLIARSPLETIILVFYPYTVLFYACGSAAIVFLMNRSRQAQLSSLSNNERTHLTRQRFGKHQAFALSRDSQ